MNIRQALLLAALGLATHTCFAQQSTPLRVWAYQGLQPQLERWETAFTSQHPEIHFANTYHGSAAVMAGLYNGVADFALMGREVWPVETMAYRWVYQQQPFGLAVATAGLNAPGQSFTPVVIVNTKNPLISITLAQLDAVYGSEHRNAPANIRTWGDLGLTGVWAKHPIHVYGFGGEDSLGVYFRHDILKMDFKPNSESHLFTDSASKDAAQSITAAIAADPYAIGYTAASLANRAKILSLATTGEAIAPTAATLKDHNYPMTRSAYLFFRRSNDMPLDHRIDGFVRFILSAQGQSLVRPSEGFLPLNAKLTSDQLHKLEAPVPAAGAPEE